MRTAQTVYWFSFGYSEFFHKSVNYLVFGVPLEEAEKEALLAKIDKAIQEIDSTIEELLKKKEELIQKKNDLK